ncbi:hypothetical protein JXQ70_08575 [bacterium]|nr:hypothetical protein [bacterium]
MASKDKISREEQKDKVEKQLAARIAVLKEKGKSEAEIGKDSTVRKLNARRREAIQRIKAIDRKVSLLEIVKKMSQEKAAIPKAERKLQKKTEDQPDGAKKEKKAKKKKESVESSENKELTPEKE